MNIQEQEHWDYEDGCQSELQNAYQRSHIEIDLTGDTQKIQEAVANNQYCIVEYVEIYCPSTDAFIGEKPYLLSVHEDYYEACNILEDLFKNEKIMSNLCIEPRSSDELEKPDPYYDDDIPF